MRNEKLAVLLALLLTTFPWSVPAHESAQMHDDPQAMFALSSSGLSARLPNDLVISSRQGDLITGDDVLYEQLDNPGTEGGLASQDYETANDAFDNQIADDFTIPQGQLWRITQVDVVASESVPLQWFNVYFFNDASGLPGTEVARRMALPFSDGTSTEISIDNPVFLGAGTWWIAVQARLDFADGRWKWMSYALDNGAPAAIRNPGGGYGDITCEEWTPLPTCVPSLTEHDRLFRLHGAQVVNSGTFPPDEFFDGETAPELPTGWMTSAIGTLAEFWSTLSIGANSPPNIAFAPDVNGVADMTLESPAFVAGADQQVSFTHRYDLEALGTGGNFNGVGFDGAVLEISINGGAFEDLLAAGGHFRQGGYNATVSNCCANPLAGRGAWSSNSGGFVTTMASLPASAAGQSVVLRFRTADDGGRHATGWWVDSIHLFNQAFNYTVTSAVDSGYGGHIDPSGPQIVASGATPSFNVLPDMDFETDGITATCGGSLVGSVFTTTPVESNCSVIATFKLVNSGVFPPDEFFDEVTSPGLPADWLTGATGHLAQPWITTTSNAHSASNAAFAHDVAEVADIVLNSPSFQAVNGQTISFRHRYLLESGGGDVGFDGAVLEISIDGAGFQDILAAGGDFVRGGYNRIISADYQSPLAGRRAWGFVSTGYDAGEFALSIAYLPASAAGHWVALRFRLATDASGATYNGGWWLDTIHLGIGDRIFAGNFD